MSISEDFDKLRKYLKKTILIIFIFLLFVLIYIIDRHIANKYFRGIFWGNYALNLYTLYV